MDCEHITITVNETVENITITVAETVEDIVIVVNDFSVSKLLSSDPGNVAVFGTDGKIFVPTPTEPEPVISIHNELEGLNEGDYQHLTAAEKTFFDSISEAFTTVLKNAYDGAVSWIAANGSSLIGMLNSKADLDINGKVPLSQMNDAVLGNVHYQGIWDVATNIPNLDVVEAKGHYYINNSMVKTTRYGLEFNTGDWIISDGVAWGKVDNTDAVSTVNGQTGNVVTVTQNITNGATTTSPSEDAVFDALASRDTVINANSNAITANTASILLREVIRTEKIVSGTTYTIIDSDKDKVLVFTSATAVTVTIPSGLSAGNNYECFQKGAGQLSFVASGTTLRYSPNELLTSADQYATIGIDYLGSNEHHVYGRLTAI